MPVDEILFGQSAVSRGYLTKQDFLACLDAQKRCNRILKKHVPIGEIMIYRDLLSAEQYYSLLNLARTEGKQKDDTELSLGAILFGEVAVGKGFVSLDQLIECLDMQKKEDLQGKPHRLIGEIMIEQGYLTRQKLERLVAMTREETVRKIRQKKAKQRLHGLCKQG